MEEVGIMLFIGIIIGGFSAGAGCSVGRQSMKVEAVKEGVAHWLVVNERGETEFFWIQCDCDGCRWSRLGTQVQPKEEEK